MEEIGTITPPVTDASPSTAIPETPETPEISTPETPGIPEVPETPAPETETGEAPEGEEETELPGEPEDEGIETDGRKLDKETAETISRLKKTDAAAAKLLAKQFYGRQAYEKEFPTVQEARQARATLDSLGGEEGITEMHNKVSDYEREMTQFANGDRALGEALYKQDPVAVVKNAANLVDILTDNGNMAGLDEVLLRPIVSRLRSVGMHENLVKAANFLREGNGQAAFDTLTGMGQWLAKITTEAEAMEKGRTVKDPREEQFARERAELDREKRETYDRAIGEEVLRLNNNSLSKTIEPFFKEIRLKEAGRKEFTKNLQSKVWAAMKEDKVFQRQAAAVKGQGDKVKIAQFMNAKFSELLPRIFRDYKNSLYPNLARAAARPANGQPTPASGPNGKPASPKAVTSINSAAIKVADAPAYDDVDWDKTDSMLWVSGKAHLKNGKFVNFY